MLSAIVLSVLPRRRRPRFLGTQHEPSDLHEAFSRLNQLSRYENDFADIHDPLLVQTRRLACHEQLPGHLKRIITQASLQLVIAALIVPPAEAANATTRSTREQFSRNVAQWTALSSSSSSRKHVFPTTTTTTTNTTTLFELTDFILELANVWNNNADINQQAITLAMAIHETIRLVDANNIQAELLRSRLPPPTVPRVFRDVLFMVCVICQMYIPLPGVFKNLYLTQPVAASSVTAVHIYLLSIIHSLPEHVDNSSFQRKFQDTFPQGTLHQALVFCLDGWNTVWRRQNWPLHTRARQQLSTLAMQKFHMTKAEAIELLSLVGGLSFSHNQPS